MVPLHINRSNNDIASTDGKSEYNTMELHDEKNEKGFTLIELLVAMVIGSIALAGIYGAYRAQLKSHVTQNAVVDVQQNLRSALYFLQKSIRMAGYEKYDRKDAKARLELDFLDTDPERDFNEGDFDQPSGARSDANNIAFTMDTDGSGVIEVDDTEIVAYRLDADELQIWKEVAPDDWEWIAIAENISRLEFVYFALDDQDDETTVDLSTGTALERRTTADSVRSVGITIWAKIEQGNPMLDADKTSRTVSARVKCRNLGLPQ